MPEDWLRRYYETGDNECVLQIIRYYNPLLDRLLRQCIVDKKVRVKIWTQTLGRLRQSRHHPELHWDLRRGTLTGFILSTAFYLAYQWLVWFEDPQEHS
jgi:hypothetical protein